MSGTNPSSKPEEGGLSGAVGAVGEKAQEWASQAGRAAEQAWDATRQGAQEWAHTAEEALDSVGNMIRRYPVATFCCGVALGFLLAEALRVAPSSMRHMQSRY
jgi:hypothetical protein